MSSDEPNTVDKTANVQTKPATTVEALRIALEQMGLNTKGHKPELKQRYRKALKKQKEAAEAAEATEAALTSPSLSPPIEELIETM